MNTLAFIPFLFALFVANAHIRDYDMVTFVEILIFFFWIGYIFFSKIYYEKNIIEFNKKYGQDLKDKELDLIFQKKYDQLKELRLDYLEIAKNQLPNGAYRIIKHEFYKNDYSKLRKFLIFIDNILPITILVISMFGR